MIPHVPNSFHKTRIRHLASKKSHTGARWMEFKALSVAIAEYQIDMLSQMRQDELSSERNLTMVEQQPEIKLNMRPLLLNFLMEVNISFRLSHQTFVLAVNLIDRYCSLRIVKKQHYQLLGLSALWISSKSLDPRHKVPLLDALRGICAYTYGPELFKEMEKHILKSLGWAVTKPTFIDFMDVFLNILVSSNSDRVTSMTIQKNMPQIVSLATYLGELFHFFPEIDFNNLLLLLSIVTILLAVLLLRIPLNLLSLMFFFNSIPTEMESGIDPLASTTLSISSSQAIFNDAFFDKLLKNLHSPPNCLGRRYFESSTAPESFKDFPSWLALAKRSLVLLLSRPVNPINPCTPPSDSTVSSVDIRSSSLAFFDRNCADYNWSPRSSQVTYPLTPQSGLASPYSRTEFDSFSCPPMSLKHEHYSSSYGKRLVTSVPHLKLPQSQLRVSPLTPGHLRKRSHEAMAGSGATESCCCSPPRR